jgi:hypothetical protein
MVKYSHRLAFFLGGLLIFSLLLAACGGENTPAPAANNSSSSTNAASQTTAAAATTAAANNQSDATATPVVLANLPPASPRPTTAATASPRPAGETTPGGLAITNPTAGAGGARPSVTASGPSSSSIFGATPAATATAALPQISPAPLSAFNLKSATALGQDQKTITRVTTFTEPIGTVPPAGRPGTLQGIALVAGVWKMGLPLVWCEDTKDALNKVWSALSFSLSLDNQPVDLKSFQTVDFDLDGSPCRAVDVALGAVPSGVHALSITRKVLQEVETGTQGQKLAPGDYIYQIILYSVLPNPGAKMDTPLGNFKLGSSTGANITYANPAPHFAIYSDFQEQYKPGTYKYTAALLADDQYGVVGGWCAKDQPTLEDNWKKMTYSVTINGQAVDLKGVPTVDTKSGTGQACRNWDLSMTTPEGQHSIIIKLNFKSDTNDGTSLYAAGDYIWDYTVLSVKPTF